MSPVHSIAAPDLSIRHHHVSPTPETLFPECPDDLSPQQVAGSLVPLAGQHGSNADRATPDCPPAPVATDRPPNHSSSPVRNSAADPSNRAHARLVGDVAHKYSYQSEASGGTQAEHIAIGTATDPYQPAEREYRVTRACLEELAKREGLSISIITKSDQIVRDIDVLQRIADRSDLAIDITITTLRTRLARMLEPRAPRPDLRLTALKQLTEAGLAVGVSASPLIPGITDREGDLEAVAAAGKEAGAQWFFSGVLFLMPSSAKQFFPFLRAKFPRLVEQYEKWFAKSGYAPEPYRRKTAERVARIRQMYGLRARPWVEKKHTMPCRQMSLEWDGAVVAKDTERTASLTGE